MFRKKSYSPLEAADATIGSSGQDVMWICQNLDLSPDELGDAVFMELWSEYLKVLCALNLMAIHQATDELEPKFIDQYLEMIHYRLEHAEGTEYLLTTLTRKWYSDMIDYSLRTIPKLAELSAKNIASKLPAYVDAEVEEKLHDYLRRHLPEIEKTLVRLTFKPD